MDEGNEKKKILNKEEKTEIRNQISNLKQEILSEEQSELAESQFFIPKSIRQGWLFKKDGIQGKWTKGWFVLSIQHILLQYPDQEAKIPTKKYSLLRASVRLSNETYEGRHAFEIEIEGNEIYLVGTSREETAEWHYAIEQSAFNWEDIEESDSKETIIRVFDQFVAQHKITDGSIDYLIFLLGANGQFTDEFLSSCTQLSERTANEIKRLVHQKKIVKPSYQHQPVRFDIVEREIWKNHIKLWQRGEKFYLFSQIKKLTLVDIELTELPPSIVLLRNVTVIDLSNNHLTEIPDLIGELENLETLNLCKNRLKSLPDNFGKLSQLRVLLLKDNRLTTLPQSIAPLPNLQLIDIRLNPECIIRYPPTNVPFCIIKGDGFEQTPVVYSAANSIGDFFQNKQTEKFLGKYWFGEAYQPEYSSIKSFFLAAYQFFSILFSCRPNYYRNIFLLLPKVCTLYFNIVCFILFLTFFTMVVISDKNTKDYYYHTNAIEKLFFLKSLPFDPITNPARKTFLTMLVHTDIYTWLQGPFSRAGLFVNSSFISYPFVAFYDRQIGPIYFRQLRVRPNSCNHPSDSEIIACFGNYNSQFIETGPFVLGNQTIYYTPPTYPDFRTPKFDYYPQDGGYVLEIQNYDNESYFQLIQSLQDNNYFDLQTRAFIVEISFYSANLNVVTLVRALVELRKSGQIVPWYSLDALLLDNKIPMVYLIPFLIFFIILIFGKIYKYGIIFQQEIFKLKKSIFFKDPTNELEYSLNKNQGPSSIKLNRLNYLTIFFKDALKEYFSSFWNTFEIMTYFLIIVALTLRLQNIGISLENLDNMKFLDFQKALDLRTTQLQVEATALICAYLNITKYFSLIQAFGVLAIIVREMVTQVIIFFIFYFIFLISFAVGLYVLLFYRIEEFQTYILAIFNMLNMTLGSKQNIFSSIIFANSYYAIILFFCIMFVFLGVILLTIFIATLNTRYGSIRSHAEEYWLLSRAKLILDLTKNKIELFSHDVIKFKWYRTEMQSLYSPYRFGFYFVKNQGNQKFFFSKCCRDDEDYSFSEVELREID